MKKIILSSLFTSVLFAQNINISNDWHLFGAIEDINVSTFDNTCVDHIWKYDNTVDSNNWRVYISNNTISYSGNLPTFSTINKGEGFWLKSNSSCLIDTNTIPSTSDSFFTSEMIDEKEFYYVFIDKTNPSNWGSVKQSYSGSSIITSDINNYVFSTRDYSIDNGDLKLMDENTIATYSLNNITSDYYEFDADKSNNTETSPYVMVSGKYFFDLEKALEYEKSLEIVENSFFKDNEGFVKPKVVKHAEFSDLNFDFKFKTYSNSANNTYTYATDGLTFSVFPLESSKSQIAASFRNKSFISNGLATTVETGNLDENRKLRVKLQMNGYNDGTQDIQPAIQILKDKVVFYQWQSKTDNNSQTLTNWTTVLDGIDFSNKEVRIALWIDDNNLHFYAQADGMSGYKTFDISSYTNYSLEESQWMNIKLEANSGAVEGTSIKFKEVYTIK